MGEGRAAEAWGHTSAVLAMLANVNRNPKKTKAFTPADFNPCRKRAEAPAAVKGDITALKALAQTGKVRYVPGKRKRDTGG